MFRAVVRLNRGESAKAKNNPEQEVEEMTNKILVLITEGSEEAETIITVDTLRTAGLDVTIAGVNVKNSATCKNKVRIIPDVDVNSIVNETFDCVVIPGGPGAQNLAKETVVGQIVKKHYENNKLVCAICLGPIVLLENEIGFGKKITSHPNCESKFSAKYNFVNKRVVQDGNLITSQGPGTAFDFALLILENLAGTGKMKSMVDYLRICFETSK